MSSSFDAVVIGAGQAGPSLAARLAAEGRRVAVVERKHLGGSCVNFGCTPTKAMVASARAAWRASHAAEFGVAVSGDVAVDMSAVRARAARIVAQSRQGLQQWLDSIERVRLFEGHARFVAPDRVEIGGEELQADQFFINTGSRTAVPDIPGLAGADYWTPTRITELDRLPDHLVILGGGAIGVEYAQMFRRFGSRVTVIERHARLLEQEDTDISDAVQQLLEAEGIAVLVSSEVVAVERGAHGTTVRIKGPQSTPREVHGSNLLLALGRRPNSDDLGLEAAGIATDQHGFIRVGPTLRTSVNGIWALGDVTGEGAFTHTAYNDYEIVADDLFGSGSRSLATRIAAHAVYIDPPLGRAGLNETETRSSGRRVLLAKMSMSDVARAREEGDTRGFIKLLVDAESERIIGAAVLGLSGDEVIHGILYLMYAGASYRVLRDSVGIHPTVSELLPSLVERLEPMPMRAERAAS